MAIEKINGFDAFMFDGETTELTTREQALMLNALRRTVHKWAELSTGDCSEECKAYNQSQINAINQIGLWLKSLPVTASNKRESNPEIEKQILF